jgi:meckelin
LPWRTLFCANEFNDLQAARHISLELVLVWLAYILVSEGYQYLACPNPSTNIDDLRQAELTPNPILRFAHSTFWWLLLTYGQILVNWLIIERKFVEPISTRFIDLCTMAKVSCLILDEKYHGYYLHCNSHHPFADESMGELAGQLASEQAGLLPHRGLPERCLGRAAKGASSVQVFEIFVTEKWRKKYESAYARTREDSMKSARDAGRMGGQRRGGDDPMGGDCCGLPLPGQGSRSMMNMSTTQKTAMFRASSRLNRFLQSFILNENPNYLYTVVDPMLPPSEGGKSIFDRLARTPPQMISEGSGGENKSIFHACRHNEWTDCLVYGNEHDMILFNILTCSVCDLWFGDTVTSILLTYLLMEFIMLFRRSYGHDNLGSKTLVDSRFLL